MYFCQALWDPTGELLVWAECSRHDSAINLANNKNLISSNPFTAPLEVLKEHFLNFDFENPVQRVLTLSLPTDNIGPLVSPKLLSKNDLPTSQIEVLPWSVNAYSLKPYEAISFLSSLPEQLDGELRFDDSLKFWREVTKFTLELLTRGSFLPQLLHDRSYSSRWAVLPLNEDDFKKISLLSECLPAICLSFSAGERCTADEIIESFVSRTGDELIRSFLSRIELTPKSIGGKQASAHREWLRSLTARDSAVIAPDYELLKLEQRLKHWGGSLLKVAKRQDLRMIFKISPPKDQNQHNQCWIVDFLIGNTQENISAAQVWRGELGNLSQNDASIEDYEDTLLKDLGRACSIFPELREALIHPYPSRVLLSTERAYEFLRTTAPRLEQLGLGVILPAWWTKPAAKLGLKLSVDSGNALSSTNSRVPLLAVDQLLDFNWNVALGDQELSQEEFKQLLDYRSPLIRVGEQWVELDPARIEATVNFLRNQEQRKKMSIAEALHFGLGIVGDETLLPVTGFKAKGWIEMLLGGGESAIDRLDEPPDFKGELRPYQKDGLSWLSFLVRLGIGGCLADDMGLGKTIEFLAFLLYQRELNRSLPQHRPNLLVVPMSILANWEQEARRFAPSLRVYLHHGAQRPSGTSFLEAAQTADLVVTTYSLMFRDEESFSKVSWAGITLDEAQNIKNLDTKQTQAIRRIARKQFLDTTRELPLQRIALTGTPLENRLEELWSILDFLNPGFLGTVDEFRRNYAIPIERFRNKEASQALSQLLKPFVLRRVKTDPRIINDLPEKIEMDVITSLTPEQAALYQSVVDEMLPAVNTAQGIHRKGLVLSTITKLKQICNHPALFLKDGSAIEGRSHKVNRLEQIVDEIIAEGDKVLIFTQFAQMGHLLRPYLQEKFNTEVLFLHGALPKAARDKIVEHFQQKNGPRIFILSLKAGGFGLNLTEANQVIHVDRWWNPAVEEQATDRAYRIGQKRNVQVRRFICQGTLEQRISEMLQTKKDLAQKIVGSSRDWVTQMSTDELRALLQLSGAVEE